MALVNRSFSVNITPGMMPPIVHVSEYDVGRAYTVSILDEQGNTFTIPTGTTASIEGTLNGSVGFTQSASISSNQVTFTLSQNMTAYAGKAWCKIKLTQNSQPIQTCAFILAVDRAGVEADTVIGAPGFEEQIAEAAGAWLEDQGFQSPTVSITPITGGNRVTFTDAQHPQGQSIDVLNGEDGETTNIDATLTLEDYAADAKATGDAIVASKTAAKNETIAAITEPASDGSSNGNVIDPSNIKKLGYYFDTSDGVTHVTDANNQWLVSENKIPLGDTDIVVYAMTRVVVSDIRSYEILCYQDDTYLGKTSSNFSLGSTTVKLIALKPYTNAIRLQCNTYGSVIDPADLCMCLDKFDTFVEYGGGSGDAVIKATLIDSASVLSEITEKVADSRNLVDPKNFRAWGYYWGGVNGGLVQNASYQWQTTKEPILTGSAIDLYARVRNPVDSANYRAEVLCWNGETYLGSAGNIAVNTTDEQHKSLLQGTDRIRLVLNIWETTFDSKDMCVSLVSLDEFEEFSYSLKIKPSVLPNGSDATLSASKRSSLYQKKIVFFGDSIIHDGLVPSYVGQMTGARVYNAGLGGTAMSIRGTGTDIYSKWYTMANLADCIASGDWADTISAIEASDANNKAKALADAQYMSQLNWDTDVDAIVIMYGANDPNTDNANDRLDTTTYAGAARHVVETILTAHPTIKIVFCTVIYRTGGENGGTVGKRDKIISVCEEYNLQCIDNYSTLGINELTASTFLADGLHPSAAGKVLMYNHIAQELW